MHSSIRALLVGIGSAVFVAMSPVGASAYSVSDPTIYGNLSVYLIHGKSDDGVSPNTLDRALKSGDAEVVNDNSRFTVQNFSDTPIFVPFGTLLKGGSQDQVVAAGLVVPPHSAPIDLTTYCVDPFRSSARFGQDSSLVDVQTQIPSLTAKLSMLSGGKTTDLTDKVRQSGVWWSIDTIQARLSEKTKHPLSASPDAAGWKLWDNPSTSAQLRERTSAWVNSLPLALQDRRLARLERPIVSAFDKLTTSAPDIVGAAFAINGHWVGAEIDASHALFEQTWQSVLRGYVIESLVEGGPNAGSAPTAKELQARLDRTLPASQGWPAGGMTVDDLGATIRAVTGDGEHVVQTSLVPKLDPAFAQATPAAMVVSMLETDSVNGHKLASLTDAPRLTRTAVTRRAADEPRERWTAITPAADAMALAATALTPWATIEDPSPKAGDRSANAAAAAPVDAERKMLTEGRAWFSRLSLLVSAPVLRLEIGLLVAAAFALAFLPRRRVASVR